MQTTRGQKNLLCGLFAGAALAASTMAMSALAAPVPLERVKKLAGGIASSVQVSFASGASVRMAQTVSQAEAIVSAGEAELDLSSVWGTRPELFVVGISTMKGKDLP